MGFSVLDFVIMLAVVAMLAWFATKQRRRRVVRTEESPLLPGETIDIESSPLLKLHKAQPGSEPFFFCFDTETVDVLVGNENIDGLTLMPNLLALSFCLLDRSGRCIFFSSEVLQPSSMPTADAIKIHGITTEQIMREGRNATEVIEMFRLCLVKAHVVVAHNLAIHKAIVDQQVVRLKMDPLPWQGRDFFCTMLNGQSYLRQHDPFYPDSYPSLRTLYAKLYYDRYNLHFYHRNKSKADLLLVIACLVYLYRQP